MVNKMNQPLVSIIIRTCQRPHVLERALNSVRKQTYKNIQVVIVEDGENKSERYIREKFPDLNMLYYATGKKCGRSHAGNVALKLSEGELLNFLDDDDMLFPKHIEALVNALTESSNMAAYSIAEERQIIENSKKPDEYKVKRKMIRYKQPFNRLLLSCHLTLWSGLIMGLDNGLDFFQVRGWKISRNGVLYSCCGVSKSNCLLAVTTAA